MTDLLRSRARAGASSRALALLALMSPDALARQASSLADHPWRLELEGGAFWQSRNDVRIPGDTGTRFDLRDLTGDGAFPVARISLDWDASEHHGFRLVYAPLRAEGGGSLSRITNFNGAVFAPGAADGAYRFDTYRLTWRYRIWHSDVAEWRVGLTGLLRDASIEVEQGATTATRSNTGFVPLLHLDGAWRLDERWSLLLDVDAAAAPQGRAVDLSLKAGFEVSDRWRVAFGYRGIEGGADNDEVYNFSWIHAGVVSLSYDF